MAFRKKQLIHQTLGFTLIELVIVVIVLAVLAAAVLPKLTSQSTFEDYTVKDQLISRLRLTQLQNMNADPAVNAVNNACYWLVAKSACFYSEHTAKNNGVCSIPSANISCDDDSYSQYNIINFSDGILMPANYHFDLQGRLTTGNSPISLTGENNLMINIESEGYIHE
ncbi:prepilin-type N-terminal cleavage/methylation domain-containing protein [Psychromonas sp. RZ22]|uniref:prepilin-type N-terminal cleavage/methylation domain-containing protein n=1 Tax=Psychromonas algarum TaxID=2555643 RepID=UPI0010677DE9|nr:prepilin-type N-terminal cleavage/methylation domain-containing protein [Psychromonas sp. RZ22]TEW56679.1 prepilin-type N-terminal cleavage/methylation domain-containing protein [Psychromonas sp. RZ22]